MNGIEVPLLAAYVSVTILLVITPGATTTVVIRNTVERGFRGGAATAAGAAAGNITHATAAGLGLALLFQRWPAVVPILRAGGAAYLAWLAVGSLTQAWRGERTLVDRVRRTEPGGAGAPFRDGLLVNLLNPPIIAFYLSVPAFLPPGVPATLFALLAAVHVSMAFVCHLGWAVAFGRLRTWLSRPGAIRWLDAGAGIALLALAIRSLV
jgi:threonine/homoserine/homoserine lactone efflux protein